MLLCCSNLYYEHLSDMFPFLVINFYKHLCLWRFSLRLSSFSSHFKFIRPLKLVILNCVRSLLLFLLMFSPWYGLTVFYRLGYHIYREISFKHSIRLDESYRVAPVYCRSNGCQGHITSRFFVSSSSLLFSIILVTYTQTITKVSPSSLCIGVCLCLPFWVFSASRKIQMYNITNVLLQYLHTTFLIKLWMLASCSN